MAACFKLLSLAKRLKPPSQFPEFQWSEVKIEAELGSGTFGSVYLVAMFLYTLYTLYFLFLQQSNLDYVDPQITYLLFEAGQSSTNICYNI